MLGSVKSIRLHRDLPIGRTLKNTKIRSIALAAVVSIATLLIAPTAANAAPVNYNVDCDAQNNGPTLTYYAPTGGTVTLNLTNCVSFVSDPFGTAVETPVTTTLVGHPGDYGFITGVNTQGVLVQFGEIKAQHTPTGELLLTKNVTIPATAKELNAGPSSDPNDPQAEHNLGGKVECQVATSDTNLHVYSTLNIKVSKSGSYTFRGIGSTPAGSAYGEAYHPLQDSFIAVYSSFDPTKPDDGIVGCNDDLNDQFGYNNAVFMEDLGNGVTMEGHQPYFVTTLQPGYYTVVLMTWDAISAAEWTAGSYGGTTFAPGAASTKFEMWGPTGGLTEGVAPAETNKGGLADTGSIDSSLPLAFASLISFAGAVLLMRRPRRRY